ncbi:hypothetical protein KQX54_007543 [Cotesia glomerata]|uniref:HAP1 N-terminal domain-containing protein n=1 Tax=Cotesia glomerata TaxID=32391 RepID=A0AAV7I953_COTGL|nr:hypothetical protein KQX54_007543 [Cotesia glomerata]
MEDVCVLKRSFVRYNVIECIDVALITSRCSTRDDIICRWKTERNKVRYTIDLSAFKNIVVTMLPKKDGQLEPFSLEDMISDLQTRRHSLDNDDDVGNPHELLKQRERDLVLAAELGKALLERNQELTRQSEAIAEEYANKLELTAYRSA